MDFITSFLGENGGLILAGIGAAFATLMAGIGSAKAVGLAGESASLLVKEQPDLFGQALILQLLPATQGLYGFVIGLLIILGLTPDISLSMGWYYFIASLPVGIAGYTSAPFQARVSVAGMQILTKNPENSTQGIVFAAMVETYAILGFVISLLMLLFV